MEIRNHTYRGRFTGTKMREQFYSWHGGQWSPLYAAASSGLVADVDALQAELRACAESLWTDPKNFRGFNYVKGKVTQTTMRRPVYAEWQYLRRVADALPLILSEPFIIDGMKYRALPWAKRK